MDYMDYYDSLPIYFSVWELDARIVWVVPLVVGTLYAWFVAYPQDAKGRRNALALYLGVALVCLAQDLYTGNRSNSGIMAGWAMLGIALYQAHRHVGTARHYATMITAVIAGFGAVEALGFIAHVAWSEYHVHALDFAGERAWEAAFQILLASIAGSALVWLWKHWSRKMLRPQKMVKRKRRSSI